MESFLIAASVLTLFAFIIFAYLACTQSRSDMRSFISTDITQPFAIFDAAEIDVLLPQAANEARVYGITIEIRGTDAKRGDPILSPPDIEQIEDVEIVHSFTYDSTWSPNILPSKIEETSRDATYLISEQNGNLAIRFLPSNPTYLAGYVRVTLAAISPRPQDFYEFDVTSAFLI